VQLDDIRVPYDFGSDPESAAQHASEIGILRNLLEGLDAAQTARAMAALTEVMASHASDRGVLLDSRIWVVRAVN
jgi:hypothetical protein